MKTKTILSMLLMGAFSVNSYATNDVMLQGFYWDVPVDEANKNGSWWDNLADKAPALGAAGFSGIWVPPPSKGNWGIIDMGYGIYDHYDLGEYDQKGSIETRFGSKVELQAMILSMHDNNIEVYADVVLNHIYSNDDDSEANPSVKDYVMARASDNQYVAYPSNDIKWSINSQSGRIYIKIKGYGLTMPWNEDISQRGYELSITPANDTSSLSGIYLEQEPNDGDNSSIRAGNNAFPGFNKTIRGFISDPDDIDEFWLDVPSQMKFVVTLKAKQGDATSVDNWLWTSQNNGFYPAEVWWQKNLTSQASNITDSDLVAMTNTNINVPMRNIAGTVTYPLSDDGWDYLDFHPANGNDWLGDYGSDELVTNTKFFGNDLNTYSPRVQTKLKDWGQWLLEQQGFDGFRLDFVRGIQPSFVADWVNNLPKKNNKQPFIVGEYWGGDSRIKSWVNQVESEGSDVDAFDFPLKSTITAMTNQDQNFNMTALNHAGMIRNNTGNELGSTSVVTFVDNHDTGKEHDKWLTKDFKMAYAYILTHEGKPTVFYPHYYGVTQHDHSGSSNTVTAGASLQADINKLIFVRNTYLDGGLNVLSETGAPYGEVNHVYVARRFGNQTKGGAIVVINNHDTQNKGLWVTTHAQGFEDLAGQTLVNAFDLSQEVTVYADGRAFFSAPQRGYAVYVKKSDYIAY
ncbi:MAG: alpha-amylase [Alteromonadales bacterium]|nr:alpha-amylase [Alteromonadales bacterium]